MHQRWSRALNPPESVSVLHLDSTQVSLLARSERYAARLTNRLYLDASCFCNIRRGFKLAALSLQGPPWQDGTETTGRVAALPRPTTKLGSEVVRGTLLVITDRYTHCGRRHVSPVHAHQPDGISPNRTCVYYAGYFVRRALF